MENKYKCRLVFYHSKPGFFRIDEPSIEYSINKDLIVYLVPRDADKLINATKYHVECGGFMSMGEAKECGEKLRIHLRMLNCMLDLGLTIPSTDGTSGSVSESIKHNLRNQGIELLDTIVGLHVFPDDENHFEHVTSAKMNVYPSDPYYVLEGIKKSWMNTFEFNEKASEVLEILNIAACEKSPKIKYLATYLAMEQMIKRKMRSEEALGLIDDFIQITDNSNLSQSELTSLAGALGSLKEQSFSSAFVSFSKRITSPKKINEMPVTKFVSKCISLRNKIAHNVTIDHLSGLDEYTTQLRNMVMSMLWAENNFPELSVYRPSDQVGMEKMETRAL